MDTFTFSFFQSLIKAMPGCACVLNPQMQVLAFNSAFGDLMEDHHNVQVSPNQTLYDKVDPATGGYWAEMVHKALAGQACREVLEIRKNGLVQSYTQVEIKPLGEEEIVGVLVEVNDITEQRRNEMYLVAFRELAENLPNTDVFLCDHKMNVLIAGGGEMKKFNTSAASFDNKNLFDMAVEFNVELLIPYYERGMAGEASKVEYEYGPEHYCVEVHPVMENERVKTIIVVARNITDLKTVNIRLQQLNKTKDNILGVVAHDLRNPISAILGILDLVKEQPGLPAAESHTMMERSCNAALSTINDLLDISELGNEDYVLETEVTYLNEYLSELVNTNRILAESKQIELEFRSDEREVFSHINQDKFSKALNNLLTNAIKFSHPSQKVVITTSRKKKKVLISIIDQGIGIPAEMQEYIFDKFTRAGRRGTAGEKSIGLGMSIVKQIVLLHKGNIWVDSRENIGTAVHIELDSVI